jgi:hypothetical protein
MTASGARLATGCAASTARTLSATQLTSAGWFMQKVTFSVPGVTRTPRARSKPHQFVSPASRMRFGTTASKLCG